MTITVHAREALYTKQKDIPPELREKLINKYTLLFFEERACQKCEFLEDRKQMHPAVAESCETCAGFKGGAQLATDVIVGKNKYFKTPIGDQSSFERILSHAKIDFVVKEHFPQTKFKRPIRFTGTFKGDYQKEAVSAIILKKKGVMKSPPRTGKTVIFSAAVTKIGRKTLILASQREWLNGFKETFVGSDTQKALTDCDPSQIGFAKKYEDFLKYDICLVTVQTFYSEDGQKLLEKIKNLFPVVGVDEVHTSAAPKYATILAAINCEWCIGLSGTPSRKDGRFSIMRNLIGPNIYEAKVGRLKPAIKLVRTEYSKDYKGMIPWVRLVSSLEKDVSRLKLIAKWAIKDANEGHMILIPFAQVAPIKKLVELINKMAGKKLAYPFWGGLIGKHKSGKKLRDVYIDAARNYKIKILVGNIKLLSTGTNIPRASCLYEVTMGSNKENAEQRFSRILTPWNDKPAPVIRIFMDNMTVRKRCLAFEYFHVLRPMFKPDITSRDEIILNEYFKSKIQTKIEL